MAFNALKHRDVAQVDRMLKGLVCFVAELAFVIGKPSKINRVSERSGLHILFGWSSGIVDHRVANVAVIPDHFAGVADVFAVMTAETSRRIEMADVVWMRLPIRFHLREKVRLEDALNLFDGGANGFILA